MKRRKGMYHIKKIQAPNGTGRKAIMEALPLLTELGKEVNFGETLKGDCLRVNYYQMKAAGKIPSNVFLGSRSGNPRREFYLYTEGLTK